jgi:hypothetical protein
MVSSELLQSATGTIGVLLGSERTKVGADKHEISFHVSVWVVFFRRIS